MRTSIGIVTGGLVLLLGASVAQARDLCVFYTVSGGFNLGTSLIILKKYSPPRPGDCKPIHGFVAATVANERRQTLSGTACLNNTGTLLVLSHTVYPGNITHSVYGPQFWYTGYDATVELSYPWLNTGKANIDLRDGMPLNYSDSRAQTCVGTATLP